MNACPVSLETLLDYLEERLASSDADRLRTHLAGACPSCRTRLEELQRLTETLRQSAFEAPSEAALQAATRVLGQRRPRPTLTEWLALPVAPPLALSRLREGYSEPIQFLFETERHDIVLWVEPSEQNAYYGIAQVRSRSSGNIETPLWIGLSSLDAEREFDTVPNSEGELHLAALAPGRYHATIHLSDGVLRLAEIELPPLP